MHNKKWQVSCMYALPLGQFSPRKTECSIDTNNLSHLVLQHVDGIDLYILLQR